MLANSEHHFDDDIVDGGHNFAWCGVPLLHPSNNVQDADAVLLLASVCCCVRPVVPDLVWLSTPSGREVVIGGVPLDLGIVEGVGAFGDDAPKCDSPDIAVILESPRFSQMAFAVVSLEPFNKLRVDAKAVGNQLG